MRHLVTTTFIGLLALSAAAPAWAGGNVGDPSDPRYCPAAPMLPSTVPVEQRLDFSAPIPAADAWLAASGPCCGPCAPSCGCPQPCAPPAPCGVCRKGYNSCGPAWGWEIMIGGWLTGLDGTVGARGRETDVDMDPWDALENIDKLDFMIIGSVRATYGRWNFRVGAFYQGLGDETDLSDESRISVETEQWIVEGAIGYRVSEVSLGCGPCAPCMAFQPFVGVRYNSLEITVHELGLTAPIPDREETKSWADLIVGAELIFDFRNHWWARISADIGGFGLSADTDMTWSALAELGYMFNDHVGVFIGVMAIDTDYEDGGFTWDVTQYGPYIGVKFAF